ncbi:MAG: NAD(P)H-hydrate dehydratase, partial [Comamonadaceae bacterium]
CGEVWLDDLGASGDSVADTVTVPHIKPTARLSGANQFLHLGHTRSTATHASHKGSFGDVAVIGGETHTDTSMAGAALLAAQAALHAGAGRVMVALLGSQTGHGTTVDVNQPELMFRPLEALDFSREVVVCGCGGGKAVAAVLDRVLSSASSAVLDADALNAIASDSGLAKLLADRESRGFSTVITPHPLEAARLLGCSTADIQQDRLSAAGRLAQRFHCTVVLKGSGSVVATPGELPVINPTGNALLATAGTGDVLAGMIGAGLARGLTAATAAERAIFVHGDIADRWTLQWPEKSLTASGLARAAHP